MPIVRVKPDVTCSVYDDETDTHIALLPGAVFDSKDRIVKAFAWAFQSDADTESQPARRTAVSVEQATANPGERR
jgi:hypothetical protein